MCVYKQLVHADTLLPDGHGLLFLYPQDSHLEVRTRNNFLVGAQRV